MSNSMTFSQWVQAMHCAEPAFKECLLIASSGLTPNQWVNYYLDPEWRRQKDQSADGSIAEVSVTSEEHVAITQFDQVREFLMSPSLTHLAVLAMLGTDSRLRVYAVMACGEAEVTIKVMMGAPGDPWEKFLTTNERDADFEELLRWLSSRPQKHNYIPSQIFEADRLIVRIGRID